MFKESVVCELFEGTERDKPRRDDVQSFDTRDALATGLFLQKHDEI